MRGQISSITALAIALSAAVPARAEQAMSWEECLREAHTGNLNVKASRASVEKNEAMVSGSYASFLPGLSGSVGYTASNSAVVNGVQLANTAAATNTQYSLGLTASQNLFRGFSDVARVKQSGAQLESSQQGLRLTESQARSELRNAFARILYNKELLELSRTVADRRKINRDLVQLRFEGGTENKGNFLRSDALYKIAVTDVAKTERDLVVARKSLSRLLGRNMGEEVDASGKLDVPTELPITQSMQPVAELHPNVLQTDADVRAADAGVTRARGAYYPTIDLSASVTRRDVNFPPQNQNWSAGVTITVPLLSIIGSSFETSSAIADRDRAESTRNNTKLAVFVNLQQGMADYQTAIQKSEAQADSAKAAEIRAKISRSRYEVGQSTYFDWDSIENDYISQQQQLLSSKLQVYSALAAWELAQGKGLIE